MCWFSTFSQSSLCEVTAIKRKQDVCLSRPKIAALGKSIYLSSLPVSLSKLPVLLHRGKCYTALLEDKKVFLVGAQREDILFS